MFSLVLNKPQTKPSLFVSRMSKPAFHSDEKDGENRESTGEICLHVAAQAGRSAVVEVLVKEGGRELLVCKDNNGASALYYAGLFKSLE